MEKLVNNIRKDRHRLGIALMSYGGLRVSEMCNLKISDINVARGFMKVTGKGNKQRFVPLTGKLQTMVEQFLNRHGTELSPDSLLREIPEGAYITGEITIHDYAPEIRSTDFIEVTYRTDVTKVALSYANPGELGSVILVDEVRKDKIKRLTNELTGVQISRLEREQQALKARLKRIRQSGFYENYSQIIKLDSDIKKIQSRIDTLAVRAAQGADEKILSEIRSLESGGRMSYELWICEI
jgi:hypothetical protein